MLKLSSIHIQRPNILAVVALILSVVATLVVTAFAIDTPGIRLRLGAGVYAAVFCLVVVTASMFEGFLVRLLMWSVSFVYLLFCFVGLGVFYYYLPSAGLLFLVSYRSKPTLR
jgi:hypothetical protein